MLTQTRNGLLATDPGEFNVSRSLLDQGGYGLSDIEALTSVMSNTERPSLVFVGAHIGSLLIPIALATRPLRVVAFEPSPANHKLLELNLRLNGVESVDVHRAAVGDVPGTRVIYPKTAPTPATAALSVRTENSGCAW